VRCNEVFDAGEIRHALRFTVHGTKGYVYPASHDATSGSGGDARPPLGSRVRLKASGDVSTFAPPARHVPDALRRPGSAEDLSHAEAQAWESERREGASGDQPLLLAVAAERRAPVDLERLRSEVDEPDLA